MSSIDKSTIEDLQEKDSTLKKMLSLSKKTDYHRKLCWRVLHEEWITLSEKDKDGTKLVVPKGLQQQDTPELFWPELCQDVIKFCRSCDVCQRTFKKGIVKKVPLGCVPLIAMPFKRIAVGHRWTDSSPGETGH